MAKQKAPSATDSSSTRTRSKRRTSVPVEGQLGYLDPDVKMGETSGTQPQVAGPSSVPPTSGIRSEVEFADPSHRQSELVNDTLPMDEHTKLDGDIPQFTPKDMADRIYFIIKVANGYDQIDAKYRGSSAAGRIEELIGNYSWIIPVIDKCAEDKSWSIIRRLKILRPATTSAFILPELSDPVNLTSWKTEFKGKAADVLIKAISVYACQGGVYARHCNIVNSSGTGKSRLVDEVAKTIITLPMFLGKPTSSRFPPPDEKLCKWLLALRGCDQDTVSKHLYRLVHAILVVMLQHLKRIQDDNSDIKDVDDLIQVNTNPDERSDHVEQRQGKLAARFRTQMLDYTESGEASSYRQSFLSGVIELADQLLEREGVEKSNNALTNQRLQHLIDVGKELAQFIDRYAALNKKDGMERPLVILSFDECNELTEFQQDKNWSIYTELRHVLSSIVKLPIFCLFLSTAGNFHLFSPEARFDPSVEIREGKYWTLPPMTATGFDQFAPRAVEGDVTLKEVVTDKWICHLGRPLFGSRYDAEMQTNKEINIVSVARIKLLGGQAQLGEPDDPTRLDRTLACFSVRFPLEFNFSDPEARTLVRKQVENHMRLCTTVTSGFEVLLTTTGSEPLLAEAAKEAMDETKESPVEHLSSYMDVNCIDRGQRGELVAALLIMQARDSVAKSKGTRSIYLIDFLETLLGGARDTILQALPSSLHVEEDRSELRKAFKDAKMWFNHVLKVRDADLINVKHLWKFMTRGAMILCANNQRGVDIVLPICFSGDKLSRDSMTALLLQVKNDKTYGHTIRQHIFAGMDPFDVGLFDKGARPLPVIRMVFALASEKNSVVFSARQPGKSGHYLRSSMSSSSLDAFTSYDVWCAGLFRETFGSMQGADVMAYKRLLDRTTHPHEYDVTKVHKRVVYPSDVAAEIGVLLRHFDPLLEHGPEHQSSEVYVSYQESAKERGSTSDAKGKSVVRGC